MQIEMHSLYLFLKLLEESLQITEKKIWPHFLQGTIKNFSDSYFN